MRSMKLDPVRLAHSSAIVTAIFYTICWVLIGSMPVFYMGMMRSWIHGVDITALPRSMMSPGVGLYGLITMTVVAWATGYVFAAVYNALGKK